MPLALTSDALMSLFPFSALVRARQPAGDPLQQRAFIITWLGFNPRRIENPCFTLRDYLTPSRFREQRSAHACCGAAVLTSGAQNQRAKKSGTNHTCFSLHPRTLCPPKNSRHTGKHPTDDAPHYSNWESAAVQILWSCGQKLCTYTEKHRAYGAITFFIYLLCPILNLFHITFQR